MKTTGVLPEALAASISWVSRSEIVVAPRSTCSALCGGETVALISSSSVASREFGERSIALLQRARISLDAGASRRSPATGDPDWRLGGFEPGPTRRDAFQS